MAKIILLYVTILFHFLDYYFPLCSVYYIDKKNITGSRVVGHPATFRKSCNAKGLPWGVAFGRRSARVRRRDIRELTSGFAQGWPSPFIDVIPKRYVSDSEFRHCLWSPSISLSFALLKSALKHFHLQLHSAAAELFRCDKTFPLSTGIHQERRRPLEWSFSAAASCPGWTEAGPKHASSYSMTWREKQHLDSIDDKDYAWILYALLSHLLSFSSLTIRKECFEIRFLKAVFMSCGIGCFSLQHFYFLLIFISWIYFSLRWSWNNGFHS